jgi:hypothetical protein
MPKVEIDYSNTIIYKITCKDASITDVYVGHTTNFVQRKHAHKQSCNNNNCKLYNVIRDNGGWQNWIMEIVNFFNCHDHYEARKKEQEYFILLNATLNSIEPMPKPKGKNKLYCECCDYLCSKKSNFESHLATSKHFLKKNGNAENTKDVNYTCEQCNKLYKSASGLWKHRKICKTVDTDKLDISTLDMNLIMQLLKQNDEFKSLMVEQNNKMMETFQEVCKNNIAKEITIDKTTT